MLVSCSDVTKCGVMSGGGGVKIHVSSKTVFLKYRDLSKC